MTLCVGSFGPSSSEYSKLQFLGEGGPTKWGEDSDLLSSTQNLDGKAGRKDAASDPGG